MPPEPWVGSSNLSGRTDAVYFSALEKVHHAKVLDFGLARVFRRDGVQPDGQTAATVDSSEEILTSPWAAVGTVDYMSPEQIRGEKLDARTDLFSFGVVLYEMATGSRPFRGTTSGVVFDAILNRVPTSPVRLNPGLPSELEGIVNRALEKDRELRYQNAADIRADLKRVKRDTDSSARVVPSSPRVSAAGFETGSSRKRWMLLIACAVLLVAAVLGYRWFRPKPAASRLPLNERQLTHNPANSVTRDASISANGRYLAYLDLNGLHIQTIDTGEEHDISLPDDLRKSITWVGWFPDGERLLSDPRRKRRELFSGGCPFSEAPHESFESMPVWVSPRRTAR
jgi:eukaryotic-like serine/threonine-protein kinase